jgi:hypothetical protein
VSGRYGPFYRCPGCGRKTAYHDGQLSGGAHTYYCRWPACEWHDAAYLPPVRYFEATEDERAKVRIG